MIAPGDHSVPTARARAPRTPSPSALGVVEATFDPLPVDAAVAREWGRLAAAVVSRGGTPHRRAIDLAIAATADVHGVPLLPRNRKDFDLLADLVETRGPPLPR